MTQTAVGICIEGGFMPENVAAKNAWWLARDNVIGALKPQVVRTATRSKQMLDLCASHGCTLWAEMPNDSAQIIAFLNNGHPANSKAASIDNEPWFRKPPVQGDQWANQVKGTYIAVRKACPNAHLSIPIIVTHSGTTDFLKKLLKAWPDMHKTIDSIDVHPYSNKTDPMGSSYPATKWQFEQARQILDAAGMQNVKFVATEFGWSTHGSGGNAYDVVDEATQAAWEDKSFAYMIARGDVLLAMPYLEADSYSASDNENEQRHFGHYRDTGSGVLQPKPVATVFTKYRAQQVLAGASPVLAHGAPPVVTPPTDPIPPIQPATQISAKLVGPGLVQFDYPDTVQELDIWMADSDTYPVATGHYSYLVIPATKQPVHIPRLDETKATVYVDVVGRSAAHANVTPWWTDTQIVAPKKRLAVAYLPPVVRKTTEQILDALVPKWELDFAALTTKPIIEKESGTTTIVIDSDGFEMTITVEDTTD